VAAAVAAAAAAAAAAPHTAAAAADRVRSPATPYRRVEGLELRVKGKGLRI